MDLKGQELAEFLLQIILFGSSLAGFVVGYMFNSFALSLGVLAVGTVVATIILVPDWPFYNKNPNKWSSLPTAATENDSVVSSPSRKNSSGKSRTGKAGKRR